MHFDYHIPTKIIFGRGRLKELATEELPGSKALIVITNGQSMKRLGYLNQVTQYRFSQGDCVGCDQSRQLLGICQGQGS